MNIWEELNKLVSRLWLSGFCCISLNILPEDADSPTHSSSPLMNDKHKFTDIDLNGEGIDKVRHFRYAFVAAPPSAVCPEHN